VNDNKKGKSNGKGKGKSNGKGKGKSKGKVKGKSNGPRRDEFSAAHGRLFLIRGLRTLIHAVGCGRMAVSGSEAGWRWL
jgi:hypothetical protein